MKLGSKILIITIFIGIFITFNNKSYAGTQRLNLLDYNAVINNDGSMDVVETWDIHVSETNTLFKNFDMNYNKFSDITNVKVKDLTYNIDFTQIYEEMYHVTENCYYALPVSGNKFEIAWGVGLDNSSATRKYEISYTVKDVVAEYNDCSEIYWMFVSESNGIPAKRVTGNIVLPKETLEFNNLRVWAHGPLNGQINKNSNNTVTFNVDDFQESTMLEVRIVTEEKICDYVKRSYNNDYLDTILKEEQKWANEANFSRMKYKLIFYGVAVIYVAVFLWFASRIVKYIKENNSISKIEVVDTVGKYFRDIPREAESTPASAAYLYYSKKNNFGIDSKFSKIFSATLLDLSLKKYIEFENNAENLKIKILSDKNATELMYTEKIIYDFLCEMDRNHDNILTIEEMKKYAKISYDDFNLIISNINQKAKLEHIKAGNYDSDNENEYKKYKNKATGYFVAGIGMLFTGLGFILLPIVIEWIIAGIILNKISNKINVLTQKGEIERLEWKGLKNYMNDFSLLNEKNVPDLILWEKFLVYATAFGISKNVVKQLKAVYPDIYNLDNSYYTYMPLIIDSRIDFIDNLNNGINKVYSSYSSAYSAAHYSSSGSGGGGGFSSGGGGRRWRRPEWAEDRT